MFKIMAGMWARLGAQLACCPCSGKHGLLAFLFAVFLFLANIISASRSVQESGDVSWIPELFEAKKSFTGVSNSGISVQKVS